MATKAIRAAILTTTRAALIEALSLVPATSRPATAATMTTAGRLTMPPCEGAEVSTAGRPMPMPSIIPEKYPAQPTATAEQTTVYSRIRLHPTIQAAPSPSVV